MSNRRRFLRGLTSLPLAAVLANPRLAAAVSAGLQEVDLRLDQSARPFPRIQWLHRRIGE
jgi:hypothetical protein